MYVADDTIVAVATPPGRGGLAVVRLSGSAAVEIVSRFAGEGASLVPRRATLVTLDIPGGVEGPTVHDEAIVTWFAAPSSYTGEDVVEVSLHGSPLLASRLVGAAANAGARLARAGEFTLRAFLNGRLDLAQAEAVEDLVSATTSAQAAMAFDQLQGTLSESIGAIERELFGLIARLEASVDFPEEGYHFVERAEVVEALRRVEARMTALLADGHRGRTLREGVTVAVVGRPNVGKSTVFNRLVGRDRAIVTPLPGTTRDLVTETIAVEGIPLTLVDTAGWREASDPVEREGIERARLARGAAALVLVVLDGSEALTGEDLSLLDETRGRQRLVVVNKRDLPSQIRLPAGIGDEVVPLSALRGEGVDELRRELARTLLGSDRSETAGISNIRHIESLTRSRDALARAIAAVDDALGQLPEEFLLSELAEVRQALEEITGKRTTDELLEEIFSRFCVGK